MVNRHQVSLIIKDQDTSDFVDKLKKDKRLKTQLVKFLDKYQQNPYEVEAWLNEEEWAEKEADLGQSEKLLNLRQNLEIFTTYLEAVKIQNSSNVDSFTDLLNNDQYVEFRTEFEKSQQRLSQSEVVESASTVAKTTETKESKTEMQMLKDDVDELKTLVRQALTAKGESVIDVKTSPTNSSNSYLSDSDNDFTKIGQKRSEPTEVADSDLEYSEEDVIEDSDSSDHVEKQVDEEPENLDSAMDVYESLMMS